jgi:hypothetical protein
LFRVRQPSKTVFHFRQPAARLEQAHGVRWQPEKVRKKGAGFGKSSWISFSKRETKPARKEETVQQPEEILKYSSKAVMVQLRSEAALSLPRAMDDEASTKPLSIAFVGFVEAARFFWRAAFLPVHFKWRCRQNGLHFGVFL